MTAKSPPSAYVLGSADAEHQRLIRQAARLAPLTERLFREAGAFASIAQPVSSKDTVTVYGWKALAGSVIGYAMDGFDLLIVGFMLAAIFQEAGLPAPAVRMEVPLGDDSDFTRWMYDVICSLRPQIQQLNLSLGELGDFDTLPERLQAEVAASNGVASWMAVVGAWCRKPTNEV